MHDITDALGDVKTPDEERLLKPTAFAIVNKNLLNYPLARDTRVKLEWHKNKKTGRYWAYLPGDDRIKLSFPADADRRCPNGLDINVLFFLLSEVRKQGRQTITLPSLAAILNQLGLSYGSRNLRRLNAALELWSCISIRYECYYAASRKSPGGGLSKKGQPVVKRFPPPIGSREGRRLSINADWCEQQDKFVERLVLPLPMQAAAQNVVLCTHVTIRPASEQHDAGVRKIRRFCRKVGLDHNNRSHALDRALEIAVRYFKANGGLLVFMKKDRRIAFVVRKPNDVKVPDEPAKRKPIKRVVEQERTEPVLRQGTYEDGRPCTWYEQPDGRNTEDYAGLKSLDTDEDEDA
jgi:hypothetical protein